ncbi:MAG: tRNA (adenosine(37)-N6)-dimethylallyltransferase MiaA, partial [Gemmatimonadetes bacterium]|nr:tRNA (adenosine(37)-N6)-dimethylallyltransferase MiaA [Gemmatimonadota bacterium]
YSAGRFAREARCWMAGIRARSRVPLLVGGTGFFLRALTHPLFREPPMPPERRERFKRYVARHGMDELRRWLGALDPASAAGLASHGGRQRVTRVLEVTLLTGRPLSWWHSQAPPQEPPLEPLVFVLTLPRPELHARIDARVQRMLEAGLVEEVERLLDEGYDAADPGMKTTGYGELIPYFHADRTVEQAVAEIRRNTRRYARRQLTWFRNQLPAGAIWLDASRPAGELVRSVMDPWCKENP